MQLENNNLTELDLRRNGGVELLAVSDNPDLESVFITGNSITLKLSVLFFENCPNLEIVNDSNSNVATLSL